MTMPTSRPFALLLLVLLCRALPGWSAAEKVVITADANWAELPVAREILPGSILDFSFLNDAPAGKYGRIVAGADGHLVYEKTRARVRLTGNNLCFGANYLSSREDADRLARYFQLMGYNTIRFHHIDVDLIRGGWNATRSDTIDTNMLDRLDYMFAAMKKAGLYVSTDLYTMRYFGADEIPGWDVHGRMECDIKALLPVFPAAFDAWSKYVVKLMNHVNPYTGSAWKDDPALFSICPLNEDSIASVWSGNPAIKALYLQKFDAWLAAKDLPRASEEERKPLLAQFLTEVKVESDARTARFLKQLGVKALLTGCNWWDLMTDAFPRSQFEIVDNHHYWDHPNKQALPASLNQSRCLTTSKAYICPVMKAPSRIFGKPFMLTEYNYVLPNQYRAEGGALFGAYAALQEWDAAYRFAWSHSPENILTQKPAQGFDMATDPLNMLTERQILLLFRRGDVSAAKRKYVYAVSMQEATKPGVGDMWSKGLFPREFTTVGLVSQIGSQVIDGPGDRIRGTFTGVTAAAAPSAASLAGNRFIARADLPQVADTDTEIAADTGEIFLNNKRGTIRIVTPLTECLTAPQGCDLRGSALAVTGNDAFSSISASAMDQKPLADSRHILLFHLTNVLNSGMTFSDRTMKTIEKWGALPYLVHVGSATIALKNSQPQLKLYAVDFSGKRTRQIAAAYADGAYQFKVQTVTPGAPSTMIYELAAQE